MKNSNKLLLIGFLAVVFLISAIHITLYAKYKAGDYTVYNPNDYLVPQAMQSFPNILVVSVHNLAGATVKFGDVAEVAKGDNDGIEYVQKGDTLLITGRDNGEQQRTWREVAVQLPYNATLSLHNSSLSFQAGKKTGEINPVLFLEKSEVFFSGAKSPLQFGHVKVAASDDSKATFRGNTQINNLEVQLSNSSIVCSEGNFGQLSIVTDSLSHITLQSKLLVKANITTIPPK
jgi:hypothetical protein